MIAQAIVSAFSTFLADPGGLLPPDAMSDDPGNEAWGGARSGGFLNDAVLPADPARAAIIAVIDDAIPFAHEMLRAGDHSRVAAIWAQDARPGPGGDLPFGREWRGQGIDRLLAQLRNGSLPDEDSLYRAAGVLDYGRGLRPSAGYAGGHGAAVAMLAAGFAPDDTAGRDHPVIGVSLPSKLTEDSMGVSAPPYILAAILFVVLRARQLCRFTEERHGLASGTVRMPLVINISYGLTAGPRDGSSLLEQFMDALSRSGPRDLGPIRFVLPMGNHRQAMLCGRLRRGQELTWRLQPGDHTDSAVEIWGPRLPEPPTRPFVLHLAAPGQPPAPTTFTADGQISILRDSAEAEIARAYYIVQRSGDGRTWREGIVLIAMPTSPDKPGHPWAPPGDWQISIDPQAPNGIYEISVQRDEAVPGYPREARQSALICPHYRIFDDVDRMLPDDPPRSRSRVRRRHTLNTYAGGAETLRAGAVQLRPATSRDGAGAGSIYSGLLTCGRNGDIQAVTDRSGTVSGIAVAGRDSGSVRITAGTSLAAPQLARWLAGQMAAGFCPATRDGVITHAAAGTPLAEVPVLPYQPKFPEY
ncbi:MAG: hypothetical protein Q4G22_08790 [Paracoccus sp. (in: a-proteobacteria)]|uniref:hypothetical protein n=1 Tax=Paracoccus sp. TaxID=267 RepID=UPI0026E0E314|nr:hypothetical protein [Paracoccus sp. (in: a-proteobacteria)]MDO5631921.1 hypothetical protein [Paracoccus sp. (in: a-proteobacteria)]